MCIFSQKPLIVAYNFFIVSRNLAFLEYSPSVINFQFYTGTLIFTNIDLLCWLNNDSINHKILTSLYLNFTWTLSDPNTVDDSDTGLYSNYTRTISGSYSDHTWFILGPYTDHIWTIPGLYSSIFGPYTDYIPIPYTLDFNLSSLIRREFY